MSYPYSKKSKSGKTDNETCCLTSEEYNTGLNWERIKAKSWTQYQSIYLLIYLFIFNVNYLGYWIAFWKVQ